MYGSEPYQIKYYRGEADMPIRHHGGVYTMNVTSDYVGKQIGHGSECYVFEHAKKPGYVIKAKTDRIFEDIPAIESYNKQYIFNRNLVPRQLPIEYEGYLHSEKGLIPLYSQQRVTPITDESITTWTKELLPQINKIMESAGFTLKEGRYYNPHITNASGKKGLTIGDMMFTNMGYDSNGNLVFFDLDAYKRGGEL